MDKNQHIVRDALKQLPTYQPPEQLWEKISGALDEELQKKSIKSKLQDLPVHKAPAAVWERIVGALDNKKVPPVKAPATISFIRKWMVAAVTVGVIALAGVWYWTTADGEDVSITYSEEVINDNAFVEDWDDDESAFDMVLKKCEMTPADCMSDEFRKLRDELLELNEVKMRLKQAMDFSGKSGELIAKMAKVELKRTQLLKKMINWS